MRGLRSAEPGAQATGFYGRTTKTAYARASQPPSLALRARARIERLLLALLLATSLLITACGRSDGPTVVLYSSVDDYLLREVAGRFERETGIKVLLVGDTEATKTTGLVERLLAERGAPRADVWWSSEPFGTIRLAREGLLDPYASRVEEELGGGWPPEFRAADRTWYGFACRARVIAYDRRRVSAEEAPRTLDELTHERWRSRVGMARPQFGTTRGQMAAIVAECGAPAFEAWLTRLRDNGLRLYDGNSSAVRGLVQGEVDVVLTDTDDVWVAQRNGWPVGLVYEQRPSDACAVGAMMIPNTVALIRGRPNPEAAARLLDFLLSAEVERMMAGSESRNIPVRPDIAPEFPELAVPGGMLPDLDRTAAAVPEAMAICARVLGG